MRDHELYYAGYHMTLNNKKDKIENLEDAIDAHNKDWATIKGFADGILGSRFWLHEKHDDDDDEPAIAETPLKRKKHDDGEKP